MNQPRSKVELRISCKKLKDLDVLSKSDPRVSIYWKDMSGAFNLVGNTETISNQLNPSFKTPITIEYRFEEIQNLRFDVNDVDKNDVDFIGNAFCSLTSILSKPGSTLTMELKTAHGKPAGSITIVAEEVRNTLQTIKFSMLGSKFDKKDLFGSCDPYFILSKKTVGTEQFVKIYESPVQKNTLSPVFSAVTMKLEELNGGDNKRPLKFEFFDHDMIGKHDLVGEFVTTTEDLLVPNQTFNVINHKKQEKKSSYKNSGTILITECTIEREYNFLEYIQGGCQLNLVVGIDCTASNGDPKNPQSLHYKHPTTPNQYANAIVSIGNVIVPYTTVPMINTFGFGGIIPGHDEVNHCFPMSLDPNNVACNGVAGILDCYYNNISKVQLYGPTFFAPLINKAAFYASQGQSQQNQKYTILMIITDGEILDAENTIEAIVKASGLPLSIIIIGVGNADFTNMNMLDGDDAALQSGGQRAERDIVQFVAMRDYVNKPFEHLAAEVLREVPSQFLSFMKKYKFRPNPPPQPVITIVQTSYPTPTGDSTISGTGSYSPSTVNLDKNGSSTTTSTSLNLDKNESSSPSTTVNLDKNESSPSTVNLDKIESTTTTDDITKATSSINLDK